MLARLLQPKRLPLLLATFLMMSASGAAQEHFVPTPKHIGREAAPLAGLADDPKQVRRQACPALVSGELNGDYAPPLTEGECSAVNALTVTEAGGVGLSGTPLVGCSIAGALAAHLREVSLLAERQLGSALKRVVTGPGYECRNRNRASVGKLSEHAFANAIDIAAYELTDGRTIAIEANWPHLPVEDFGLDEAVKRASRAERTVSTEAKFLAAAAALACTRFTTVLTPDANAEHRNQFHYDLGCHGHDCSYRICE